MGISYKLRGGEKFDIKKNESNEDAYHSLPHVVIHNSSREIKKKIVHVFM